MHIMYVHVCVPLGYRRILQADRMRAICLLCSISFAVCYILSFCNSTTGAREMPGVTVAEEGNRRVGGMTADEMDQTDRLGDWRQQTDAFWRFVMCSMEPFFFIFFFGLLEGGGE